MFNGQLPPTMSHINLRTDSPFAASFYAEGLRVSCTQFDFNISSEVCSEQCFVLQDMAAKAVVVVEIITAA